MWNFHTLYSIRLIIILMSVFFSSVSLKMVNAWRRRRRQICNCYYARQPNETESHRIVHDIILFAIEKFIYAVAIAKIRTENLNANGNIRCKLKSINENSSTPFISID